MQTGEADIVERLRKPTDGDRIYEHIINIREQTKSDLPRMALVSEFDHLDEERAKAAATIEALRAEIVERGALLRDIRACRQRRSGTTVHGASYDSVAWCISDLSKLLPRIDSIIAKQGEGK